MAELVGDREALALYRWSCSTATIGTGLHRQVEPGDRAAEGRDHHLERESLLDELDDAVHRLHGPQAEFVPETPRDDEALVDLLRHPVGFAPDDVTGAPPRSRLPHRRTGRAC